MAMKRPEYVSGSGGAGFQMPRMPRIRDGGKSAWLIIALVVVALMFGIYWSFLEYVHPYEYGIKEVQIGMNRGVQEQVYKPGYWMVMPFGMQKIHRLPRDLQVLEMTRYSDTAARTGPSVHHTSAANIQTSDGFFVLVDASVLYRIVDPYKVVISLGPGDNFLSRGILPKAEPFLKDSLGQLTTEEFYNSPLRVEKAQLAQEQFDAEMEKYGISVEEVLVRYFEYSPSIQENIEKKKLEDQLVFTNQSLQKAAMATQELNRVVSRGEMEVKVTEAQGTAYAVEKEAEADLYSRQKRAEADLLVELAEAKSSELRNKALQVLGADKKVAMEMAKVLQGLDVVIMPSGGTEDMNPLNLDQVLTTFGVEDYLAPEPGDSAEAMPATAPASQTASVPEDSGPRSAEVEANVTLPARASEEPVQ